MKYIVVLADKTTVRELLSDSNVKKYISTMLSWNNGLVLGLKDDNNDKILSYIMLKYGDYVKDFKTIVPDRTPIPNKDYKPKK